jgi:Uma2 family endonuclease
MVATQTKRMTEEEFRSFSLSDGNGQWELVRGQLRERPGMSVRHGDVMFLMAHLLQGQLDRNAFRLRVQHARLRRSADTYYIPDIAVIPTTLVQVLLDLPGETLDAYPEQLPLVIEIWSPSTGRYDIDEKLPGYQARGDLEIWYVHPYERTLTAWSRQPDGTYIETVYRGGTVRAEALPGVAIDLDTLFEP